ncbi:MAG: DUF488 family protein [Pyrinomonadaceae bacterium]
MPQANRLKLPSASARQQAENKLVWNEARCLDSALFFTIGYTGRRIDEFLGLLESKEVRTLVDIRQYPVSMYRPEMSKGNLKRAIEERGMIYAHFPQLGVPRDIRARAIETGTRDVIWEWYDQHIVAQYVRRNLHRFFNTLEHPVALMCVEIDPQECHRHRLSLALEAMGLSSFDL